MPTMRVGLDGWTRPVDHRPGRQRAIDHLARHPDATTEDIAHVSGLSTRSARNLRRQFVDDRNLPAPPHSVERPHVGATSRPRRQTADDPAADTGQILRIPRGDPSLRFTDGGRAFLQLLGSSALWDQHADQLIDNLPPHCIGALAQAMRTCAQTSRHARPPWRSRRTSSASG
jgi:hypothetical protein